MAAAVVDQRHSPHQVDIAGVEPDDLVEKLLVDTVDDQDVARQYPLDQRNLPGLKRLRHQCMIGVGENPTALVPGRGPGHAMLVNQQAHQLGNANRRVGIVEMDRHLLGQIVEGSVLPVVTLQDVLHRCRDEEILLA